MSQYKGESLVGQGDIFSTLVRSIVGQQISVLAADSIWGRLSEVVGPMTPENICKLNPEIIAKCGLTKPKSQYIFGIASQSENFLVKDWESMTDEEITKHFIENNCVDDGNNCVFEINIAPCPRTQLRL